RYDLTWCGAPLDEGEQVLSPQRQGMALLRFQGAAIVDSGNSILVPRMIEHGLDHMRHVEFGHARGYTAPDIVVAPIRQSRPNALVEGDLANRPAGERPIVWTTKYEVTAASLRPTVKDVAHRRSDRNNVLAFVLG